MTTPQSRLLKLADEAVADYNATHAAGGEAVYPSWVEDVRLLCNAAPGVSTVEDKRPAFEAWALTEFTHPFMLPDPLIEDPNGSGDYVNRDVQMAWSGYQQACATLAAPAAGDALDARQLMALADAVVVQWQREDKMPQMAWGFREFLVAGMQALIDSNRAPHGGDGLVDSLARLAYYYAVELESATRNADSDRLEEIARSITAKLKGEIRAAIAAQRKGNA